MNKIEWFDLLIELTPSEQSKKLQLLGSTDPELAAELTELLALDTDEASLSTPNASNPFDLGALNTAITGAVQARSRTPQFELLGLLGEGGMGEVWRAKRSVAGTEQIVALKILKLESTSAELQERFALEQRTLLKLTHPNIARLLDAGVADDGRPWIAMELVRGVPITDYCDAHQLSISARLNLFRQVIAAVQYAHDHFIVHRDIKPDNVLVDQSGVVKLLDFGIAKSMDRHTPDTLTQQRFFSLYATAPEQLLGGSVCVGTDVYALGGLLYELLSGAQLISSLIKTPAQLQSFIVEKTPTLPSKMADENAASNRSAASIAKLSAHLRGDLDRIVLHALRKLPSERYPSARAFDEDIAAYLELRPVKAAGQGQGYRAKKFLRRNWLAASISALALLSLLTLTILLGLRGNQLKAANVTALSQQSRAEQITRVLTDAFEASDPSQNRGNEVKAREVLDQAARRLSSTELDPDAFVKVSVTLANVYRSLGLRAEAQTLAEAAKLQEPKLTSPEIKLQLLHLFARIYGESGQRALRIQTVGEGSKLNGVSDAELLIDQRMLEIDLISERGELVLCVERARALDQETAKLFGPSSDQAQRTGLYYLGALSNVNNDERALEVISERLGKVSMDALKLQHLAFIDERANIYLTLNQYSDALNDALVVKNATIRLYGKDHRKYVSALALEAKIYSQSNRPAEAKPLIIEYSALLKTLYPPNFPIHANALANLASTQNRLGEYSDAAVSAKRALAIGEQAWGKTHRNLWTYRSDLAEALTGLKQYSDAETLVLNVVGEQRKVLNGEMTPALAMRIILLARIYSRTSRVAKANVEIADLERKLNSIRSSPMTTELNRWINELKIEILLNHAKEKNENKELVNTNSGINF
jgi:eukaryotic-like serine/threonine-protein kinase